MKWLRRLGSTSPKVFCIGRNKTGTTSLAAALKILGFRVAPENEAIDLLIPWSVRDFRPIVRFCHQYDAFQDAPFSCPFTYQAVDMEFPNSKFILSIRTTADEWYESLIRYHSKLFNSTEPPNSQQLKDRVRGYRGRMWDGQRLVFGITEETLYDAEIYKSHYLRHNVEVVDYFRHRPDSLLLLNLKECTGWEELCRFLGRPVPDTPFPHLNSSRSP